MDDKIIILQDLQGMLVKNLGTNVKDVILFGSQASGTPNDDSDYDFLVVLKDKPSWQLKRRISDYCFEIDLKYGIFTDVHLLAESELNTLRGKQPIFQSALEKGIHA